MSKTKAVDSVIYLTAIVPLIAQIDYENKIEKKKNHAIWNLKSRKLKWMSLCMN